MGLRPCGRSDLGRRGLAAGEIPVKRQRAGDDWLAFMAVMWLAGAAVVGLMWWLRL
jgi:hypothetical protein